MSHLDTGFIIEVDIEDDAGCPLKIVVPLEGVGGRKRQAVVTMLPQQTLDASEHAGVIVDHIYEFSFRHQVGPVLPVKAPRPAQAHLNYQIGSDPIGSRHNIDWRFQNDLLSFIYVTSAGIPIVLWDNATGATNFLQPALTPANGSTVANLG
jgi:hypothetical protein